MSARIAKVRRKTKETEVSLKLSLDGTGKASVSTEVGFLDHMLELLSKHAKFDVEMRAKGDLDVDAHHTTEDAGIVLGQALSEALGDKSGVRRFGFASVPMDEALARASVDLSGRASFVFRGEFPQEDAGELSGSLILDFFQALASNAKLSLHLELLSGRSAHHAAEAMFKATARALREAVEPDPREKGIPSTKGTL